MPALTLSSAERRALRARAHALDPVVIIGDAGLTAGVLREIERALASHELVKVRAPAAARDGRETLLAQVCDALGAAPVQHIGKVLVVFRPRPPENTPPRAPALRPRRKAPRRTKKSFQD